MAMRAEREVVWKEMTSSGRPRSGSGSGRHSPVFDSPTATEAAQSEGGCAPLERSGSGALLKPTALLRSGHSPTPDVEDIEYVFFECTSRIPARQPATYSFVWLQVPALAGISGRPGCLARLHGGHPSGDRQRTLGGAPYEHPARFSSRCTSYSARSLPSHSCTCASSGCPLFEHPRRGPGGTRRY